MKIIIFKIALLFYLTTFTNHSQSKLTLYFQDCFDNCIIPTIISFELWQNKKKIYSSKENTIVDQMKSDYVIRDLKRGKYAIRYKTLFGQEFTESVLIKENETSKIICTDNFKNEKIEGIISSEDLVIGDTLMVEQKNVSTCGNGNNLYKVKLYLEGSSLICDLVRDDLELSKIKVNSEVIRKVNLLEKKVYLSYKNNPIGSTMIESFEFKKNELSKNHEDDSIMEGCDLGQLIVEILN